MVYYSFLCVSGNCRFGRIFYKGGFLRGDLLVFYCISCIWYRFVGLIFICKFLYWGVEVCLDCVSIFGLL